MQVPEPETHVDIIEQFGPHLAYSRGRRVDTGVEPDRTVKTHCCFCGQQCGIELKVKGNEVIGFEPWYEFPFNRGMLCPKGVKRYLQGSHPDRLLHAYKRDPSAPGGFSRMDYDEAIRRVADEIDRIQSTYGNDAFALLSGASLTTEKTYLMGKFAHMALKTANIDYNGRLCMVSAAAGNKKSFGIDRAASPMKDVLGADVVWISGANVAECAPITTDYVWQARERGAKIIVVDPRITPIARTCHLYLPVKPGRDVVLFHGILHLMIENDWLDHDFIESQTVGFDAVAEHVQQWTPRRTAEVTGVAEKAIRQAAEWWGTAETSYLMHARGIEHHSHGVENVLGAINIVLASGRIGRPNCGYGTITGQGNGQGGREHGQKCDQLPGARDLGNPEHRAYVAGVWDVDPDDLPQPGADAYEIFGRRIVNAADAGASDHKGQKAGHHHLMPEPAGFHVGEAGQVIKFLLFRNRQGSSQHVSPKMDVGVGEEKQLAPGSLGRPVQRVVLPQPTVGELVDPEDDESVAPVGEVPQDPPGPVGGPVVHRDDLQGRIVQGEERPDGLLHVRGLVAGGHDVICLDNFFTSQKHNIAHLLDRPNFELIRHDVTLPIFLEVDQIYNMACPASPVHYQFNPVKTIKTSVMGAINCLGLAKRVNARVFQASTSEVYGDPEVHPQHEEYWGHVNPIGPRSCYDEGKRCAETLFFDYHRQHRLPIKVVRIFNTYGPRMLPDDGRVVSNFIVQALQGRPLTVYGEGRQTRSFCYVDDLIDAMMAVMRTPDDVTGPVNIGNPEELEIGDLARQVVEMTGTDARVEYRDSPPDDPRRRCPDIALATRLTGWTPKVPLRTGLQRTIDYFRGEMAPGAPLHLAAGAR